MHIRHWDGSCYACEDRGHDTMGDFMFGASVGVSVYFEAKSRSNTEREMKTNSVGVWC